MNAILKQKKHSTLRTFIPLNGMSDAQFDDICRDVEVEVCEKGVVLFEQGDSAQEFIYLISGMVSLYAGDKELETIVTGSEVARFAIAHQSPRKVKAVAKSKVRIVRIEAGKLDVRSASQGNDESVVVGAVEDGGEDWMSVMLRTNIYKQLPASNLQKIMMNLQEVSYGAGESVIKQGEKVDYYYIIKSGSCDVVRKPSEGARAVRLPEELSNCDTFGEEALLSGRLSDVTVSMKGGGQILRLSKSHFIGLIKKPVLKYVSFKRSKQDISNGAVFLDVREDDHYNEGHIEGSINIPLFSLRRRFSELNKDQLHVLVCEKGNESEAGVFVLLELGFSAVILNDGMKRIKKDGLVATQSKASDDGHYPEAVTPGDKEQAILNAKKMEDLDAQCMESDAQLGALKLELRDLRSEYEHKALQASQHEADAVLYRERLEAQHEDQLNRDAKLKTSLSLEKNKNNDLLQELEKENAKYDQLFLELKNSHAKLEASRLSLAELESESSKSEQCITDQLLELDSLKEWGAISSAPDVSKKLLEQLADAENKNKTQKSANIELQRRISDSRVELKNQVELKKEAELNMVSFKLKVEGLEERLSDIDRSFEEASAASLELTNKLSNAGVEQAELMVKNAELQKQVEDAQYESDLLLSSKSETNSEVEALVLALEVSQKALNESEKDLTQATKLLDEMKGGNNIEGSSFEQQVEEMAESLKSSEDENTVLSDNLRKLEQSLVATSGAAEHAAAELNEFKQQNMSEKNVVNQLLQQIEELELSNQQVNEGYKDKAIQLSEQLERLENEAKNSFNKEKEIIELNETIEQEKMTLEGRLLIANKEKVALLKKVNALDKKSTHVGSSQDAGDRVAELEKQLCEATTTLLDLEIKLEGESTVNESLSKEDTSELLALKSELNLVREQAESDVKTMRAKVENSERMNLSLNKKILSMQAVAAQENEVSMVSNKKKSWWK